MTACGYTPSEIDELTLHELVNLLRYWEVWPPVHETLKHIYRLEPKRKDCAVKSDGDPSGIGSLIARFPDGDVR